MADTPAGEAFRAHPRRGKAAHVGGEGRLSPPRTRTDENGYRRCRRRDDDGPAAERADESHEVRRPPGDEDDAGEGSGGVEKQHPGLHILRIHLPLDIDEIGGDDAGVVQIPRPEVDGL